MCIYNHPKEINSRSRSNGTVPVPRPVQNIAASISLLASEKFDLVIIQSGGRVLTGLENSFMNEVIAAETVQAYLIQQTAIGMDTDLISAFEMALRSLIDSATELSAKVKDERERRRLESGND